MKTLRSQKLRMLLTHRKLLQSKAIAIDNDLRGTLRNFIFIWGQLIYISTLSIIGGFSGSMTETGTRCPAEGAGTCPIAISHTKQIKTALPCRSHHSACGLQPGFGRKRRYLPPA